jgi:hypothetical protein
MSDTSDEPKEIVHVALGSKIEQELELEFSDGLYVIPDYVVASLGGAEKVKALAPILREDTFQTFISDYYESQEMIFLNGIDKGFRSAALRGRRGWRP